MFGMIKAMPNCGFVGETDDMVKGEIVGPLVVGILEAMHEDGVQNYIVDGVGLLPKHASHLISTYPNVFKACWLGYPNAALEKKYADIRAHTAPDDWLNPYPDDYVRDIVTYGITKSIMLKEQCKIHNIQYFDTSANFSETLNQAQAYLLNQSNHE